MPPFIEAFDCFHPTAVKTYDINQHCPKLKQKRTSLQGAEVYLLQQDFTHRTPGFRCSMTRGIRRFICGAFSYDKALRAPVGQLPVSLSGAECHRLVSTREYKDEKKKTHPIKVPGLNEIAVDEIGWESSSDGDQRCQGQQVDLNGRPVERVVEYSTLVITIRAEEFVVSNGEVSAEYSRERLSCPASQGKCAGASHAYTWNLLTAPPCPWKIVRTSHGFLTDHTFFSREDGILFELSQPTRDVRCPGLLLRQTGFTDLALAEDRPNLPRLEGGEVRLSLLFQVFQEYIMDQLNQLATNDERTYANLECEGRAANEKPGTLRALPNGRFARRMGDTHVEFSCPTVEVSLREDPHCYTAEIPVEHDHYPFVTVATRVLTTVGTPGPCLNDFPLRIKGIHGWWRLLPRVEADVPPRTRAIVDEPLHHQFDRQGGLYSVGELRQWQHLQEVPHYQRLLTADLAQGVCTGVDSCALTPVPGAPAYTLSNLESRALDAVTPAWWEKLKSAFYWGGLTLAWCSPLGFFIVGWIQPHRNPGAGNGMFPLNIHTGSGATPPVNPTVVPNDPQPSAPERAGHRALEERHADAQPYLEASREGGCKMEGPLDNSAPYLRGTIRILPGPSRVQSWTMSPLNPSSA